MQPLLSLCPAPSSRPAASAAAARPRAPRPLAPSPRRGATPRDYRILPKRIILVRHAESEGNVDNIGGWGHASRRGAASLAGSDWFSMRGGASAADAGAPAPGPHTHTRARSRTRALPPPTHTRTLTTAARSLHLPARPQGPVDRPRLAAGSAGGREDQAAHAGAGHGAGRGRGPPRGAHAGGLRGRARGAARGGGRGSGVQAGCGPRRCPGT